MFPLAWTLLALSIWTCGSGQTFFQETVKTLYPKLRGSETLECDCADFSCDSVYWFRSVFNSDEVEFIGKCTNAERVYYGNVAKTRLTLNKKGSSSFMLRISKLTEADSGIYSCVLKNRTNDEMWKSGTLLLPGVTPPTEPPAIKPPPPVKPGCRCVNTKPRQAPDGCGSLVLWPLVGLISALAFALLCVLYYFSRLPKKCRHHFVKQRLVK
ncbi:uncharacterized protein cd8b [Salarias fasciatus]|uniref:Uncharacterized LOC115389062 n=1 Tax=Salarias fasciatus TaxID=181472 RepID=A0A672HBC2_SALFA|nr:uncharacterized protein LOC115389062 [Salarias fasciatus]